MPYDAVVLRPPPGGSAPNGQKGVKHGSAQRENKAAHDA